MGIEEKKSRKPKHKKHIHKIIEENFSKLEKEMLG
jgi:hypothetical protein